MPIIGSKAPTHTYSIEARKNDEIVSKAREGQRIVFERFLEICGDTRSSTDNRFIAIVKPEKITDYEPNDDDYFDGLEEPEEIFFDCKELSNEAPRGHRTTSDEISFQPIQAVLSLKTPSRPVFPSSTLSVQEIPTKEQKKRAEVSKICKRWHTQAAAYFDLAISSTEEKRLSDPMVVTERLSTSTSYNSRIFTCIDKKKSTSEAFALCTDRASHLEIELLATHPKNILQKEDSVKGSGTAILYFLFQKCIDERKNSLELYAKSSSVQFYKNIGFTIIDDDSSSSADNPQNVRMRMSIETIQAILFRCPESGPQNECLSAATSLKDLSSNESPTLLSSKASFRVSPTQQDDAAALYLHINGKIFRTYSQETREIFREHRVILKKLMDAGMNSKAFSLLSSKEQLFIVTHNIQFKKKLELNPTKSLSSIILEIKQSQLDAIQKKREKGLP